MVVGSHLEAGFIVRKGEGWDWFGASKDDPSAMYDLFRDCFA
jgi:hypothetical protein